MSDINVKNDKLYDALSSLTNVILEIVSRRAKDDLVVITEGVWQKENIDSYVRRQIQRPLWANVHHKAEDEITKTKEYLDFVDVVNTDEIISPQLNTLVGTCAGSCRLEADNIVWWSVNEFLTNHGIDKFNVSSFNSIYSKIESLLYSKEIDFENITPLCGFTMDESEISLTENISIVKLSEKEILEFFKLGIKLGSSMGGSDFVHHVHQYAIKISYKLPKIIGERDTSIEDIEQTAFFSNKNEQAVINALRIYKEGKLYPITTTRRGKSILSTGVNYSFEVPVKVFMRNKYSLLKNEKDEFISFWNEKSRARLPEKNFLSVGIRRFSQSNERDNIEDMIIDLMISAEAIFLSSGGNFQGELKYRLSHRAAMFIENDVECQKHVFEFMQNAYDVRSSIVHGSDPRLPKKKDGSTFTLEEFCGEIEKYLRVSIKKAISKAATAEDKSNAIDWKSIIFPTNN